MKGILMTQKNTEPNVVECYIAGGKRPEPYKLNATLMHLADLEEKEERGEVPEGTAKAFEDSCPRYFLRVPGLEEQAEIENAGGQEVNMIEKTVTHRRQGTQRLLRLKYGLYGWDGHKVNGQEYKFQGRKNRKLESIGATPEDLAKLPKRVREELAREIERMTEAEEALF